MKAALLIVLGLSIAACFQFALIIYPLARRKLRSAQHPVAHEWSQIRATVLKQSIKMAARRGTVMSFNDDESLYAALGTLKARLMRRRAHHAYKFFNFPIAFLMGGLLDYFDKFGDKDALKIVERRCKDLVDENGQLRFTVDKLDQAALGMLFLRLYELTSTNRYLSAATYVFNGLQRFKGPEGLYRYRLGLDVFFIDTVGLLCPFLVRYAGVLGLTCALADAEKQVEFALARCIEPTTGLAFHAFDLKREQPLGSVNWARGMGWFVLGLAAVALAGRQLKSVEALRRSAIILDALREAPGYWPQFLGHTNDCEIDSSASLMFLYAFQRSGLWLIDSAEITKLAAQCVDRHGRVIQASGDTIYINKYSRIKGPSELSQGLMLSLIAGLPQ
jgi:unsaturated rhamnogalacturonyl hydrolase